MIQSKIDFEQVKQSIFNPSDDPGFTDLIRARFIAESSWLIASEMGYRNEAEAMFYYLHPDATNTLLDVSDKLTGRPWEYADDYDFESKNKYINRECSNLQAESWCDKILFQQDYGGMYIGVSRDDLMLMGNEFDYVFANYTVKFDGRRVNKIRFDNMIYV